jgi:flagellar biogenesis protein FliO
VVALIVLLSWGYRVVAGNARLPRGFRGRTPGLIEILSRTALSPRQSLCLVRVGSRVVLLGVSPETVRTLDVIADPDAAARLAGQATQQQVASATAEFQQCLEREARDYEPEPAAATAPGPALTAAPTRSRTELRTRLAGTLARLRAAAGGA